MGDIIKVDFNSKCCISFNSKIVANMVHVSPVWELDWRDKWLLQTLAEFSGRYDIVIDTASKQIKITKK